MWMAPQAFAVHAVWHLYNNAGKAEYALNKKLGRHRRQGGPGTDLPDYVPPRGARELVDAP